MSDGDSSASIRSAPRNRIQFGLADIMWTLVALAMSLAYLRQTGSSLVFLVYLAVVVAAGLVGASAGYFNGRAGDACYWAILVAVAAFLSVASVPGYGAQFQWAWSAVGACIGAFSGAIRPGRVRLKLLLVVPTSFGIMLASCFAFRSSLPEIVVDLVSAPLVGAAVVLLIEFLFWFEHARGFPRYAVASWLLSAVILSNLLVPYVLG